MLLLCLPSVSGLRGSLSGANVLPSLDCWLSQEIKNCARVMIESDGEYPAAAAALLVCYKLIQLMSYQTVCVWTI